MKIILKPNSLKGTMLSTAERLRSNLDGDMNNYYIHFNNNLGQGSLKGGELQNKTLHYQFNIAFENDVVLDYESSERKPFYFLYLSKGTLEYSFESTESRHVLKPFQTLIFQNSTMDRLKLYFQQRKQYQLCLFEVNPVGEATIHADSVYIRLKELFDNKEKFVYASPPNLRIIEYVQRLYDIKSTGITKILMTKGIISTILALEIRQYIRGVKRKTSRLGSLTSREATIIKSLIRDIQRNPEKDYSISILCEKGGISPAKLQEGFKIVHSRTVSDFIREERLKMAEKLLREKDLTISEVVYSVGLTSRSYFSKIFKQRYNCTPKIYQEQQTSEIMELYPIK